MDETKTSVEASEELEEQAAPANETKSAKFHRLATGRMNKTLKDIRNIGNLSSPSYEYTEEEVEKMFAAIQNEVDKAHKKFLPKSKEEDGGFSF